MSVNKLKSIEEKNDTPSLVEDSDLDNSETDLINVQQIDPSETSSSPYPTRVRQHAFNQSTTPQPVSGIGPKQLPMQFQPASPMSFMVYPTQQP